MALSKKEGLRANKLLKENTFGSREEALEFLAENGIHTTDNALRRRLDRLGIKLDKTRENPSKEKQGFEQRGDYIVINWNTRTVITDLGEYGDFVCSFDMHSAIQRMYVDTYEKGHTAAEVAREFNFPHAKAVYKYAKHHGFTKSSLGQTDLEFEEGLTEEEAVNENLQAMKRRVYKESEKRKWREVQKAADKWFNFNSEILKPFENHIEMNLPSYSPTKLKLSKYKPGNFVSPVGISDVHFMKLCYDHTGKFTYDQEITKVILEEITKDLIQKVLKFGKPEKFFVPVGNDNIHIDNKHQTTTRGTEQANSTDGVWQIALGDYVDMTIMMIDSFSQVAPVEVVSLFGNHDKHTSYLLQVFLDRLYREHDNVNVNIIYHPRTYMQYGKNCLIFSHGDEMSIRKLRKDAHKIIMAEARSQGVNVGEVENYVWFTGHTHADEYVDLGGLVKHFIMPSFSPPDDWHRDQGFIGSAEESSIYMIGKDEGRIGSLYAKAKGNT